MSRYPECIVCLTEETTETLYLLGEGHLVVGISGYSLQATILERKGWNQVRAVQRGQIHACLAASINSQTPTPRAPSQERAARRRLRP